MIKDRHILGGAVNGDIEKGRVYVLCHYNDNVENDLVKIVNDMKSDISENSLSITDNTSIPSIDRSVGGMAIGTNIGTLIINELELIEHFKVRDSSHLGRTANNIALYELKSISLKYDIPVIVCHKMTHDKVKEYMHGNKSVLSDMSGPSDFIGFIYRFDKEVNCWVAKNNQSSESLNKEYLLTHDDKIN